MRVNNGGIKMNNMRARQILQQFFIAVVVLSLFCPGNLWAKRKGAQLQIINLDGDVIEGELLRVKQDSLLVMTSLSNTGAAIKINEIDKIMVKRKSKFGKGALWGLLIGGAGGAALGRTWGSNLESEGIGTVPGMVIGGVVIGAVGALTGGIISSISLKDYKTIQVKGKSPSEIKEIMKKLHKKARFKN